jgi:hypothetical protein
MEKDNTAFFNKIKPMREEIDRIDNEILALLAPPPGPGGKCCGPEKRP